MKWFQNFLIAVLFICLLASLGKSSECSGHSSDSHQLSFSVNSARNQRGEWETSFLAYQNNSRHLTNIDVNVTKSFVTCKGHSAMKIGGFLKDITREQKNSSDHPQESKFERLTFKQSSKNAAITNDGRTLQKLKLDGFGSGITNRPLKDDEIFTVHIDQKAGEHNWGPGIGVRQIIFDGQDLHDHTYAYKSGTWMFYDVNLYQDGNIVNIVYPKKHLNEVQVGQTVGVMRSKLGTLHLFINGIDQGPAASNIPNNVYGVFDLRHNVMKGTIVDV